MLEKALKGNALYWIWIAVLLAVIGVGAGCFMYQLEEGLGITGMSRDVSWAFYIAQLTFLVGVAASAVLLVLPYYIHDYKEFGKITILGEFLAIGAVLMCLLFVFVDVGKPMRFLNVILHPTPNSILFWDATVLNAYMGLNLVVGWAILSAEKKDTPPPFWTKPLIYLSIPLAVSIHTVTAFLYAGLPGRHLWLTAVMAPRFLASAFAAGPCLLIILCLVVRKVSDFDPGEKAINKLITIATYALLINLFLFAMEFFTAYYSGIPGHQHPLTYLFAGHNGHGNLVPWMWASMVMLVGTAIVWLSQKPRTNKPLLVVTCILTFIGLWIDKGMGLVVGGFVPNPFHQYREYAPTAPELLISLGIYAVGALVVTVLYKTALSVKKDSVANLSHH